jgi:DNA-binding NarL/FixJ family response regulator
LLATGETNRQIARRLFVSEETVKSHVASILRKLEVSDRTSAAVLAVRAGLVDR